MHFCRSFVSVQQRSKSLQTMRSFFFGFFLSHFIATFVSQYSSYLFPFYIHGLLNYSLSAFTHLIVFHHIYSYSTTQLFWQIFFKYLFSTSAYRSALTPFTVTLLICKISLVVLVSFSNSSCSFQSLSCIALKVVLLWIRPRSSLYSLSHLLWWFEFRSFLYYTIIYAIDLTVFVSSFSTFASKDPSRITWSYSSSSCLLTYDLTKRFVTHLILLFSLCSSPYSALLLVCHFLPLSLRSTCSSTLLFVTVDIRFWFIRADVWMSCSHLFLSESILLFFFRAIVGLCINAPCWSLMCFGRQNPVRLIKRTRYLKTVIINSVLKTLSRWLSYQLV